MSAALMALVSSSYPAKADVPAAFAGRKLNEVVVTGKRQPDPAADARLRGSRA
jgi:hypothetical protein